MIMKKFILSITALLAVSCNNFSQVETPQNATLEKGVYTASFDQSLSRVYMDSELKLHWNSNDAISLFATTENCKYLFAGADGDVTGDFTPQQSGTTTGGALERSYALYPYLQSSTISADGVIETTLAAVQSYAVGSMGQNSNAMVAVTESSADNNLKFKNLCGYVAIQLYGENTTVQSVTLEGNGGETLAGKATISAGYDKEPTVALSSSDSKSITIDCGQGVTLSTTAAQATEFYFVVPPVEFAQGFTITVTDTKGGKFTKSTNKKVVIERNIIQPMTAVEVEIKSIEGLTVPQSLTLPAQTIEIQSLSVGCSSEAVTVSASEAWFGVVGGSQSISAGSTQSVKLWVEPNFSATARTSQITITGVTSGATVTVPVNQQPFFKSITEGFPAKLETQTYISEKWESSGICSPVDSPAVLSAVSVNGSKLTFEEDGGAILSGTGVGDYLIYAVPAKGVSAGEQFDFMCTIVGIDPTSPKYWIFEYWDAGRWNAIESELRTAEENPAIKYSFYVKDFDSAHHTTYTQSFTVTTPIDEGSVMVRLRALSEGSGRVKFSSGGRYMSLYLIRYKGAPAVTDSKRMLFVGNSFTYYYGSAFMLKEIARSEGHQIDAIISVKGSQEFSEHLKLERTQEAIARGNFDYAFLQDASPNPAIYADKQTALILNSSRQINDLTLQYSPLCKIMYEREWSYPKEDYRGYGSYDKYDYMLMKGAQMLTEQLKEYNVTFSPIGLGFRVARGEGISLLHTDNHHPNRAGAYLKSCINYLMIYGKPFSSTVSSCGVDATLAAKLRQIAQRVVLEGVDESYDFEDPVVQNSANCYLIKSAGNYSFRADIMGNGNIPKGSSIKSAELNGKGAKVLWATYNTTTAPASNDELITNVKYQDGTISFSTGTNGFKEGNAVIALYDDEQCQGNILWSWHIWFCEDIQEQSYNNMVWLDRNLGALSATAGDHLANGLFYQFGRKDPFLGIASVDQNVAMESTGVWNATVAVQPNPEQYVVAHPMQHINNSTAPQDWYTTVAANQNHSLWNSSGKTMYDPCPYGYRVPQKLSWNINMTSGNPFFTTANFVYKSGCLVYTEGQTEVVYPICGCISAAGAYTNAGVKGYYRTCDRYGSKNTANHMEITPTSVNTSDGVYRASGDSVRCIKE